MRIVGLPSGFYRGARYSHLEASEAARAKLRALEVVELLRGRGLLVAEAGSRAGVAESSYYRWRSLLRRGGMRALERRHSRRRARLAPKQRLVAEEVERLRRQCPWGKEKITVLLKRQGFEVSESMVGRVLGKLRERGVILPCGVPPSRVRLRAAGKRVYARRKRHGERPRQPGELVQSDTLHDDRDGVARRHFTAICPLSRFGLADVHGRATSELARRFLDELVSSAPFPIRSIQVDNGSEFKGVFEARCAELGIELLTIKPHAPKMNAVVERTQRTFRDEFYALYPPTDRLEVVRERLAAYLDTYNRIRPHQSLNNLTPLEYLANRNSQVSQ